MVRILGVVACLLLMHIAGWSQLPLLTVVKRQPTHQLSSASRPSAAQIPWVVYSDRADNPTYREASFTTKFKQLGFGQACYVVAERKGFLRLIQYDPALKIGTFYAHRLIKSRQAAGYVGWVPKSQLLLTSQAPVDSGASRPTLYCPVFASSRLLQGTGQLLRHDSLRLFAQPSLSKPLRKLLKLYDLTYVYKLSESGGEALIGATDWFTPDSAATHLLGWAPTASLQSLGEGLFVELDSAQRAQRTYPLYNARNQAKQLPDGQPPIQLFPAVPWAGGVGRLRLPLLTQHRGQGRQPNQIGLLLPLLEVRSNSLLNMNGRRITSQDAARWTKQMQRYNVLYLLEDSPAMKPYWPELVSAIQAASFQLQDSTHRTSFRLGAVTYHKALTGRLASLEATPLTTDFDAVISKLHRHRFGPASQRQQPLGEGLAQAFKQFRNHQGENNLIILVGINGDTRNLTRLSTINAGLQAAETRLLVFQVAAPPDTVANNFVLQAQQLVMQSALRLGKVKRERLVNPHLVVNTPVYDLRAQAQNIYHLDFPKQSMAPGWVLFPPKRNRLPISLLVTTTDSIMAQLRADASQMQQSLTQAFAASLSLRSHLNPAINQALLARHESTAKLTPALFALRNYPFYWPVPAPAGLADTTLRRLRLLAPEVYDGLGQWLDLLAADELNPIRARDRAELASRFRQLTRHLSPTLSDTATLAQPLSLLLGLPVRHPLLKQFRCRDLTKPSALSSDRWTALLLLLRERRDLFRRAPTLASQHFTSNGRLYYWLSEDLFR